MKLTDLFNPDGPGFTSALDKFDSVIRDIPIDSTNASAHVDTDAISSLLVDAAGDDKDASEIDNELSQLFTDLEHPKDRLARFAMYDAIYNNVQLSKRAITVYLNNIFLRNAVSNSHYVFHVKANMDQSKTQQSKAFIESFFKTQDFFDTLKHITKDSLIYGDGYVEFLDLKNIKVEYPQVKRTAKAEVKSISENSPFLPLIENSKTAQVDITPTALDLLTSNILDFSTDPQLTIHEAEISNSPMGNDGDDSVLLENLDYFNELDNGESEGKSKSDDDDDTTSIFRRFIIRKHKPSTIIELDTEFGLKLGYLHISVSDSSKTPSSNVMQQFLNSVNLTGGGVNNTSKKKGVNVKIADLTNTLVTNIISKLSIEADPKSKKSVYSKEIEDKLKPEMLWAVKRLLVASGKSDVTDRKIKVRYIRPSNMHNLSYPGGVSVIDTMAYPAKLYLLIQLTNLLSRLSKSATIRKWTLDIGSREDASSVVRRLKEELRNQRITASSMITSDVSKIITDFKDLITITKNGKSYVDVNVENLGDPSTSTQDLEFQRNELIAVSGIPSSYLGYNDGYELRDQLVHANISFANEIMGVQSEVNKLMMDVLDRASIAAGLDPVSKYVTVAVTPPMVLMLQVMETVMSSFSVIYSTLTDTMRIQADPVALLEQFVPYADWRAIISQGQQYEQEKKVKPVDPNAGGGF